MRIPHFLSIATGLALLVAAVQPQASPAQLAATCPNAWPHEPVLVYDVAGSTLAGPFYRHLAVYSSGHAILSESIGFGDPGRVGLAQLTQAEVAQLRSTLAAAGAATACDDPSQVSDVPLNTITLLRGGTDSLAHTSSYLISGPAHAQSQQIIDTLITTHFPGF